MGRKPIKGLAAVLFVSSLVSSLSTVVQAETLGVVVKGSTLGLGLELTKSLGDHFAVGVGINKFDYDDDLNKSGVEYEAELELSSVAVALDYHPWAGNFRISAGVLSNDNEASLLAKPSNGSYEFNGVTYNASDIGSANGKLSFDSLAPYVGIGWGMSPAVAKGWALDAEIGVVFQGEPEVDLAVQCGASVPAAACTQLTSDVQAEQRQLKDDIEDYKAYPLLSIGVSYHF